MSYLHCYQTCAFRRAAPEGKSVPPRSRALSPVFVAKPCPYINAVNSAGQRVCDLRRVNCRRRRVGLRARRRARLSAPHSGADEIDVAALDIGAGELHAQRVTDVQPFKPLDEASFGNRLPDTDRKSTRLNSSHVEISYAVFCLKKK